MVVGREADNITGGGASECGGGDSREWYVAEKSGRINLDLGRRPTKRYIGLKMEIFYRESLQYSTVVQSHCSSLSGGG